MTNRAEELITQLEAEIVKRDARIAEIEASRRELALNLAESLKQQCVDLRKIEALKAQQPSAGVVDGGEARHDAVKALHDVMEAVPCSSLYSMAEAVLDAGYSLNPCRAQAVQVQICKLGMYGAAYDAPDTCRAYTYAAQPGNDIAYRLGDCLRAAHCDGGVDFIDFGLALLMRLQDRGFGVFQIAAAPSAKNEG